MSLFKRPAWVKPQTTGTSEEEADLFKHSQRNFSSITADAARRQQERAEKERVKEEKKVLRNSKKRESSDKNEGHVGLKKRRITAEDGAALLGSIGFGAVTLLDESDDDQTSGPGVRSTRRTATIRGETLNSLEHEGASQDEVEIVGSFTRPPEQQEEEEESDPEFAELKRSAREKAETKSREATGSTPMSAAFISTNQKRESPEIPLEPPIKILITSPIKGTVPLIVYRKLNQRLQEVRAAWMSKQTASKTVQSTRIFLTHRGHKLWDVTTCRSLGLELGPDGSYWLKNDRTKEGVEHVHVEAMNDECYDQMKAEKARQARLQSEDAEEADAAAEVDAREKEERPAEETLIRLTVKAKDKPDLRLRVKRDTVFSRIVKVAKRDFQIDPSQDVHLEFDGERLEPGDQISSTEIEDLDTLDLYIAKS